MVRELVERESLSDARAWDPVPRVGQVQPAGGPRARRHGCGNERDRRGDARCPRHAATSKVLRGGEESVRRLRPPECPIVATTVNLEPMVDVEHGEPAGEGLILCERGVARAGVEPDECMVGALSRLRRSVSPSPAGLFQL